VGGAPLERVWPALSDAAMYASCVPGGELHPADDLYTGRIAFGRVCCEATVRAVDRDEDEHVATILLHGRQLGGPGVGAATVQSRCERSDSSTRVLLSAEVRSSGYEHPGEGFDTAARDAFEKAADLLKERAATAPPRLTAVPAAQPPAERLPQVGSLPVPASPSTQLQRG